MDRPPPAARPSLFLFLLITVRSSSLAPSLGNPPSPTQCEMPNGTKAACGPGNDRCHAAGYPTHGAAPQYHVRDFSCAMNDPAAVVYDPVHGVYHNHWEDHLAAPGGQYVRGHAVSRDLVSWAHMPVSLWNDQHYDSWAIFTGSATVVGGHVVQVYPGLSNGGRQTQLCIAVPADPSDPLQAEWAKDGARGAFTGYANPIANNTGRDPSSAWRTPAGEWRLTSYGSQIYGSMDFKRWYHIGQQTSFPQGECPSFFRLPRDTPGSGPAPGGGGHADTRDQGRRILWGWARVAYGPWDDGNPWESSAHTLPREVTWHPELQQLVFQPLPEQAELRAGVLGRRAAQDLPPTGAPLSLGLPPALGNQSEVIVTFARPVAAVNLTVRVMADAGGSGGTAFLIRFMPNSSEVDVAGGGTAARLRLSPSDATLELRVFVDNVFSEAYWQGGRVAMTVPTPANAVCDVSVSADAAGARLLSAVVYGVKSIWVAPGDVLRTPRRDGGDVEAVVRRIEAQQLA
eukprot:g3400.t1